MSYSIQRAVSDGTLKTLLLSIDFLDSSYIKVFIDNVEQALGTTWTWATPKSITFPAPLAAGVAVLVRRSTNIAAVRHSLSGGAQFTNATMDDNFLQMLHITQESSEGLEMGDLYNELDMHGYRIRNLGYAVDGGDAISLAQYKADADGAYAQRELASQWAQAPYGTPVAPGQFSAYHWSEVAKTSIAGVQSFKGRAGIVVPEQDDYSSTMLSDSVNLVRQDSATGAVGISSGTTAQRPGAPVAGMVRYNSEEGLFEGYQDGGWKALGGGDSSPLFSVLWWPQRSAIPAGYVAADGQTLSRATYHDAWAGIQAGNVPTVADATWNSTPTERGKFTVGDGSTTFRLPDYNGKFAGSLGAVFLRGDGTLSANVAGAIQRDAFQGHHHTVDPTTGIGGWPGAASVGDGVASTSNTIKNTAGTYQWVRGPISDGINGTPRTASETRPINVTGCWVIKLFGAVVNVGSADAAQLASDYANLVGQITALQGSKLDVTDKRVCTAWVNFNGTGTVAIRDSFNVSSITDNGTGDYTVNFATAMNDSNYSASFGGQDGAGGAFFVGPTSGQWSTTRIRVGHRTGANFFDSPIVCVQIFGGK